jgi:hypothetical protein
MDAAPDNERRGHGNNRRWTDQDHDELIRHGEILRAIDQRLVTIALDFATSKADQRRMDERLAAIERREERAEGREEATRDAAIHAARREAQRHALFVSLAVGVAQAVATLASNNVFHR